ncbi:hypothetical protein B296_00050684 [Ensete ventricosum]|uniref:Uncharacterized protein n=1 Tax=Ensete ventricosum TaxID=4639 RepID=A0A426WXJ9_ENSVE|nr:hypothetical protein B296_00050684 [Ensete ventricosum]
MKSHPEQRDKRRYCRFHREYKHDTEEFHDLQCQIEDLIRRGHLRRYVRDQSSLPDGRPPRSSSPRPEGPVKKQINVIFGEPASGGNSSSARKAYARSEVRKRPLHDEDLDVTFKSGGEDPVSSSPELRSVRSVPEPPLGTSLTGERMIWQMLTWPPRPRALGQLASPTREVGLAQVWGRQWSYSRPGTGKVDTPHLEAHVSPQGRRAWWRGTMTL